MKNTLWLVRRQLLREWSYERICYSEGDAIMAIGELMAVYTTSLEDFDYQEVEIDSKLIAALNKGRKNEKRGNDTA